MDNVDVNKDTVISETQTVGAKALVTEIFGPTIQGEGPMCGKRTFFVRFGGCPYRCSWCDTPYSVLPEQVKINSLKLTGDQIYDALKALGAKANDWITLTGGDPVLWNAPIADLISKHRGEFKFQIETQGSLWNDWLHLADCVVVSPKPPSSGMLHKFDHEMLLDYAGALGSKLHIKTVAFNDEDLKWITSLRPQFEDIDFYISAGTYQEQIDNPEDENYVTQTNIQLGILEGLRDIAEYVLRTPELKDVTVLPQMHVLMWGTKRGV